MTRVARAVQNGQVPAGALSKAIFEALVARKSIDGTKLMRLAVDRSDPELSDDAAGRPRSRHSRTAIRKAFLDLKDPAILKPFRVEGFAATDDKAYDVLRDTAKILELDLGQDELMSGSRDPSRRHSRRRAGCRPARHAGLVGR